MKAILIIVNASGDCVNSRGRIYVYISWSDTDSDTNFKRRLTGSPGGSWTGRSLHTGKVYAMMKDDDGNFYAYCYLLGTLGWKYIWYGLTLSTLNPQGVLFEIYMPK